MADLLGVPRSGVWQRVLFDVIGCVVIAKWAFWTALEMMPVFGGKLQRRGSDATDELLNQLWDIKVGTAHNEQSAFRFHRVRHA